MDLENIGIRKLICKLWSDPTASDRRNLFVSIDWCVADPWRRE